VEEEQASHTGDLVSADSQERELGRGHREDQLGQLLAQNKVDRVKNRQGGH
jgi:hypothetical protein